MQRFDMGWRTLYSRNCMYAQFRVASRNMALSQHVGTTECSWLYICDDDTIITDDVAFLFSTSRRLILFLDHPFTNLVEQRFVDWSWWRQVTHPDMEADYLISAFYSEEEHVYVKIWYHHDAHRVENILSWKCLSAFILIYIILCK